MQLRARTALLAIATTALAACGDTVAATAPSPIAVTSASVAVPAIKIPATGSGTAAPAGGFDAAWYLAQNPDVVAAKMDALTHYTQYGRWEGRLPYAGATPWRPSAPSDYETAPACRLEVSDTWAPAGTAQVRVRFRLTRFGDGTPCERSYSITGYSINPTAGTVSGFSQMNVSGQGTNTVNEVLSLPSQGSQGELLLGVPTYAAGGYFDLSLYSVETGPRTSAGIRVFVGNTQPAGTATWSAPLALPAATPYPSGLGTPSWQTDFLKPLGADGWTFSPDVALNGSVGYFAPETGWKSASGKPLDPYPIVTMPDGTRVRTITVLDQRSDLAQGKYQFVTGLIHRVLGDGRYGFRRSIIGRHRLAGFDPALWGISAAGGWPPELDTDEGNATGQARIYNTWHPRSGAATTSFTPAADADGKHEWMEEFNATTYRLWLDGRLIVERPNYGYQESLTTVHSIEGPGGAGGAFDATGPFGGLRIELYGDAWWQR